MQWIFYVSETYCGNNLFHFIFAKSYLRLKKKQVWIQGLAEWSQHLRPKVTDVVKWSQVSTMSHLGVEVSGFSVFKYMHSPTF